MRRCDLARVGEHVAHPADVAIGDRALDQRLDIAAVDVERAVEPGQSGGEAVLAAGQHAAQHQRLGVARAGGDGAVGGLERAGDVAVRAAEAGDVGPDVAVLGRDDERAVEGGERVAAVAERHVGAAADARGIGFVLAARRRPASASAARASPWSNSAWARRCAVSLAGTPDWRARAISDFGGDAVAEREIDPRLHHPRRLVLGIGLERVQELDPGGARRRPR